MGEKRRPNTFSLAPGQLLRESGPLLGMGRDRGETLLSLGHLNTQKSLAHRLPGLQSSGSGSSLHKWVTESQTGTPSQETASGT